MDTNLGIPKEKAKNITLSTKRPAQNVRNTSKEAFSQKKADPSYQTERRQTAEVLKTITPATRLMLSKATGYPTNKICQYVKMLVEKQLAIEVKPKQKCKISGYSAYYLAYTGQE